MKSTILVLLALVLVTVGCAGPVVPAPSSSNSTPVPAIGTAVRVNALQDVSGSSDAFSQGTIRVGSLDRSYLYYIPKNLPRNAPLLFVFHGAGMKGEEMRTATDYGFEKLADKNRFIVIYPEGYKNTWNDCRKGSGSAAKAENIDDVGFVRALISRFQADYGINLSRVYAMGFSNGGHLAYRLAVELTDEISAVAVAAANFSAEESCDCRHTGKPIPVVIMNGTADTLNPYNGGIANWGVRVRSAVETAEYFAKLNGLSGPPQTTHHAATDEISVDRALWSEPGKPEVELVTIVGGAHAIPMYANLDAPSEVWRFISRQHPSY